MEKYTKSQERLRYIFESAEERMKQHAEYAEECRNILLECPRYGSKEEAAGAAGKMGKEDHDTLYMVWASIVRDEEFFGIGAPWMVTSNGEQQKAAEYVGMLTQQECKSLE